MSFDRSFCASPAIEGDGEYERKLVRQVCDTCKRKKLCISRTHY